MADETYDPSEHTVDEVNEHLATLDPEGDEYAAVIQAERDGKARVGILGDEPEDETTPDADDKPELQARSLKDEGQRVPEAEGEAYQKGYAGFSPSRDAGEDLTLAGVLKRQNGGD